MKNIVPEIPTSDLITTEQAVELWDQDGQARHIGYRTSGGAWALLQCMNHSEIKHSCRHHSRIYGFTYISRLLHNNVDTSDLVFVADSPLECVIAAMNSGRDVKFFDNWVDVCREVIAKG